MAERTALLSGQIRNNDKDREGEGGGRHSAGGKLPARERWTCLRVWHTQPVLCRRVTGGRWGAAVKGTAFFYFWGAGERRGGRGTGIHLCA